MKRLQQAATDDAMTNRFFDVRISLVSWNSGTRSFAGQTFLSYRCKAFIVFFNEWQGEYLVVSCMTRPNHFVVAFRCIKEVIYAH